jgi:myo-inositol-1-phosphate synthase
MGKNGKIRVAIAGVGNCASALIQGLTYYKERTEGDGGAGLPHPQLAGYSLSDIEVVAAYDIDRRKVGRPLEEAIFAKPNCTQVFQAKLPATGVTVQMGPVLDGVADHMKAYPENRSFQVADKTPISIVDSLKKTKAEVLVCYLPVGSEEAVTHYADACLEARTAMVNCVPVFIASDPRYASRFVERKVPIVGDDIKSQFGATLLHRIITRTLADRGIQVDHTYQLNTGGNTDFLNMLEHTRLKSKKLSKTRAVASQMDSPIDDENIHIGPSDYVPWQNDNKVCFLRLEWAGFGGVPMHLEARLSVEDSPNSAGVVVDAIRCAKIALDRGIGGPIQGVSAWTMKHPPIQMRDSDALKEMMVFVKG